MDITALVVDDDIAYSRLIASYVKSHGKFQLAGRFTDPEEAKTYLLNNHIDVLFVDIEMPGLSGISLLKSLPSPPLVIFITSHPDFAIESYELNAIDYLSKPVSEERFIKAADKAVQKIEETNKLLEAEKILEGMQEGNDYIVVRTNNQYVKIKYSDILYIEAIADMIKIHTPGKNFVPLINMKFFERALPPQNFIRTHRSFIVNTDHITSINASEVHLSAIAVPLGQAFKEAVIDRVVGKRLIKK